MGQFGCKPLRTSQYKHIQKKYLRLFSSKTHFSIKLRHFFSHFEPRDIRLQTTTLSTGPDRLHFPTGSSTDNLEFLVNLVQTARLLMVQFEQQTTSDIRIYY